MITHTFATLEVSARTFKEIKLKLKKAGYEHTFIDEDTIDMHGVGLVSPSKKKKCDCIGHQCCDICTGWANVVKKTGKPPKDKK